MDSSLIVSGINNLLPAVTNSASSSLVPAVTGLATAQLPNLLGAQAAQKTTNAIVSQTSGLSPAQEAFFKESKIRDSLGKLLPVYHSSPETFTQFDDSKLGNNTGYDNTAFGHFVTTDKDYSSRFRDLDNRGINTGGTMELYANIKKPITHPYMAGMKYNEDQLDKIVEDYFTATGALEDLQNLRDYAAEDGNSLYDEYMDLMYTGENPFEGARYDRDNLLRNGYDAVEIVEGPKSGLVEGSEDNTPVSSYAVFNGANLKSTSNLNPIAGPDIYDGQAPSQQYFQGKDLNNDGLLNQVTVQRDINGDGVITPEEAYAMATGTQDTLNKNLRTLTERLGYPEYQDIPQKSLASIKNKIERKGGDYTAMSMKDHSRSKITMNSWADIPQTIEALQQAYPNADMAIENVRNDWGYSGLHITFREPNGIGVEVQLTTPEHWPVKLESDAIYDKWRTIASKDPSTLEPIVQKRLYAAIKKSQALWKAANVPDLSKYANI
jgi:hypothetical protein